MPVKPKVPKAELPAPESETAPVGDFVEFDFKGTRFIIPRNRDDWSTEGLTYLAERKFMPFVKYTLEIALPGQWAVAAKLCPRRADFGALFVAFSAATSECIG